MNLKVKSRVDAKPFFCRAKLTIAYFLSHKEIDSTVRLRKKHLRLL